MNSLTCRPSGQICIDWSTTRIRTLRVRGAVHSGSSISPVFEMEQNKTSLKHIYIYIYILYIYYIYIYYICIYYILYIYIYIIYIYILYIIYIYYYFIYYIIMLFIILEPSRMNSTWSVSDFLCLRIKKGRLLTAWAAIVPGNRCGQLDFHGKEGRRSCVSTTEYLASLAMNISKYDIMWED